MKRYILGFFTAAAAAAALWLLHRTFPCPLTALLTPVNGSPWEMGKLLYWPYLPAALVIWRMTPERQGRGGHCLLLAAMPLCMTGLCWLLPGRGLRLWSLILAGGLTLHGQVLVRRLRGGELLWYVLAILLGIAYLLLTVLAIVLGGTDPFGGVGKIIHVFCALLVLQVIATGLSLAGVSLHFNLAVWGITLIFALAFKFFKNKWQAQRAMKLNQKKHRQLLATRGER